MYRKKEFNLDSSYNSHLYTGIIGVFMRYCHRNLEKFKSDEVYSKILEIGAGTAHHLPYIKHKFQHYYVAETSDFAIDYLKKAGLEKVIKYDGKNLPFDEPFFDRIIISHVLEHVNNPEEFIMEMMSKLKKGGILSISLPTDPGLLWRASRNMIKILSLNRSQKLSNIEYDYVNSIEHINSIFNLRNIIKYHYRNNIQETFLPFRIKLPDINLFYNVHIKKL
jgi:phosphatidylethanolamine/phosphatidyl-N-methylethanolamine N-methyltransferase